MIIEDFKIQRKVCNEVATGWLFIILGLPAVAQHL